MCQIIYSCLGSIFLSNSYKTLNLLLHYVSRKIQLTMDIAFPATAPSWIDIDNISRNNIFFLPTHCLYSDFKLHVKCIICITICFDLYNSNVTSTNCFSLQYLHGTALSTALKNRWNRKMRNIQFQSKLAMIRMLGMVFLSIQIVAGNGQTEVWWLHIVFIKSSLISNFLLQQKY